MSDLILKEIYGRYKTKSLTKEQIKRYKMTESFLKSMIIKVKMNEAKKVIKMFMSKMML